MESVLDNFLEKVVSFNQYFKRFKCKPFFIHHRKTNMIEVCLDNINEKQVPTKTDCKYLV